MAASSEREVELRRGDLLRGVVEQQGIDVVVRVMGPSAARLLEIDSPNGANGPEPILLVAPAAGTYAIEVRALDAAASEGEYRLHVDPPHTATEREGRLADALALWSTAWRERAVGLAGAAGARAHYLLARDAGDRALAIWRDTLGAHDLAVADALDILGYVHDELGDYRRGLKDFAEALAIREAVDPDRRRIARTRSDLGWLHLMSGDPAGAQRRFAEVLAAEPRNNSTRQGLTRAMEDRGDLERARAFAIALRDEAVAARSDLTNPEVRLAGLELALGSTEQAQTLMRRIEERLPAPPATLTLGRASTLELLADGALARGDAAAAARHVARAREIRVAALGADHPAMVRTLTLEGRVRAAQGDLEGAAALLTDAVALAERTLGPTHLAMAPALDALAGVEARRGRRDEAMAAWQRSIRIREAGTLPTHPGLVQAKAALAALATRRLSDPPRP